MTKPQLFSRNVFLAPFCVWAGLFIFVPLSMIAFYGLTDATGAFSLDAVARAFKAEYMRSLALSFAFAFVSTVLCLIIAYPLCLILAEKNRGKNATIFLLFVLPLWMNSLLLTMAWQTILEKNGILNQFLRFLSLPDTALINTPAAIVIGMVYNFLPYMTLPIYVSLTKIDQSVKDAARDLGASSWQAFRRVLLPLSASGIISGVTMVFIPALTTFVISALLGGSKIMLIGNIIEQEFTVVYDWRLGSALSLVLMVFIIINIVVTSLQGEKGGD